MSISIPTVKPSNPNVGQIMYETLTNRLMVFTGTGYGWVGFDPAVPDIDCTICKKGMFKHDMLTDHPYCKNNLEMLEWKSEEHERQTART